MTRRMSEKSEGFSHESGCLAVFPRIGEVDFPFKQKKKKRYRKSCIADLVGTLQEVFSESGLLSSLPLSWIDTTMLMTKIARKLDGGKVSCNCNRKEKQDKSVR